MHAHSTTYLRKKIFFSVCWFACLLPTWNEMWKRKLMHVSIDPPPTHTHTSRVARTHMVMAHRMIPEREREQSRAQRAQRITKNSFMAYWIFYSFREAKCRSTLPCWLHIFFLLSFSRLLWFLLCLFIAARRIVWMWEKARRRRRPKPRPRWRWRRCRQRRRQTTTATMERFESAARKK